ncbi:MAG: GntR family transcriptional regulator [Ignavibacteria bacterium]|jgi:DNA-binding LacI/PurR family transcriptional regulator
MASKIDYNNPAPLYEQIERIIKERIKSGKLKAGSQIGSHHELSKEFNVSLITVKKALANLVKDGVLFTRIGKGTYVAEQTRPKIDISKHKTIGLVLRDLKHPFFSMIVHSIEERAYELGYNLLLSSSSGNIEKEESQIEHFRKLGVDGMIIASLSLKYRATDYIQKIHDENFPYIMVSYMHDPDFWYVGSDQENGGYIATEHLIQLGFKKVSYVHVGRGNLLSEVRKNGFYRALIEHDKPFDSDSIVFLGSDQKDSGFDRFKLGYNYGKEFSKHRKSKSDALFFYSDIVALGFLQSVLEEGLSVPDDVAIVGFDDIEIARYASVPLTTVHQDADKIGRLAVEIVQKRIDGKEIGNRNILKPTLSIRESTISKTKKNSESIDKSSKTLSV